MWLNQALSCLFSARSVSPQWLSAHTGAPSDSWVLSYTVAWALVIVVPKLKPGDPPGIANWTLKGVTDKMTHVFILAQRDIHTKNRNNEFHSERCGNTITRCSWPLATMWWNDLFVGPLTQNHLKVPIFQQSPVPNNIHRVYKETTWMRKNHTVPPPLWETRSVRLQQQPHCENNTFYFCALCCGWSDGWCKVIKDEHGGGGDAWTSGSWRDGREERLLTLLFSPVQWTIAWLWVASPLSTNELLSREICFSRDSALLKRGELSAPAASSSSSLGKPDGEPPCPPPISNIRSTRRFKAPLSQRTGPGCAIQAEAVNRKTQRCAAAETGSSGRRGAMLCAVVALVSRRLMERMLMLVEDR